MSGRRPVRAWYIVRNMSHYDKLVSMACGPGKGICVIIDTRCSVCGSVLPAIYSGNGDTCVTLMVSPCQMCVAQAQATATNSESVPYTMQEVHAIMHGGGPCPYCGASSGDSTARVS